MTRKRPKNFEKLQLLIMTFSMKIPMHMFVRKWDLVRRVRILFYKFFYFCYNTDKKEGLMAFF